MELTEVEVEGVAVALEDFGGEVNCILLALVIYQLCEKRLLVSLLLVL